MKQDKPYINLSGIAGVTPDNKVTKVKKAAFNVVSIQGGGTHSDESTAKANDLRMRFGLVKRALNARGVKFSKQVWALDAIDKALAELEKTINLT
jgi:hypothetical protein